jgi:hypothetical protein
MAISAKLAPASDHVGAAPAGDFVLGDTAINPRTGLATDYFDQFNDAIKRLELLAETPDCRENFLAWQPKNSCEHFSGSNRDITIAAYEAADPALRAHLDTLARSMTEILMATRQVMRQELSDRDAGAIAALAARWIKALLARAGAVINGTPPERETMPQRVDALATR